jgi:hypothetical protein
MQVFITRWTDDEYIDGIRATYVRVNRWKWVMVGLYVGIFLCGLLMALWLGRFPIQLLKPPPFPGATYEIGWIMGCVSGFFLAFGLPGLCIIIPMMLAELRTWKLLLEYHGRLREAGLLPAEASRKMEHDQQSIEA